MAPVPPPSPRGSAAPSGAVRLLGRYQLLRLLGKSRRSMAWRVAAGGEEFVAVLPRLQPADDAARERWRQAVQRGARLSHPHLARPVDVGEQDGWPFAVYDAGRADVLSERLDARGMPPLAAAELAVQALGGLAFAHDGGVLHGDVQPWQVLIDESGTLRLIGLEVACSADAADDPRAGSAGVAPARAQRDAAERDVLTAGLLLHRLLAGTPALDEDDLGAAADRLPPAGRDIVRLPWSGTQPLPEALRAIVNRATDRQERQRYRSARTLLRALEGWIQAEGSGGAGPLLLLQDRLRSAGLLPSLPGASQRVARLALMDGQRTIELAESVLEDPALALELLRAANVARTRAGHADDSDPVLTVRRAIAMLGLDGLRRAALALRPWPGPLSEDAAGELQRLLARVRRAGRIAQVLRPPGWDAEVVQTVTLMQNLGRLVLAYHFPDDAQQIRRLMQPAPSTRPGEPDEPGMGEDAASFAVLGTDIEALGHAVARWLGLDDKLLVTVRRLPPVGTLRGGGDVGDDENELRLVASCANETVDALGAPVAHSQAALQRVVQRYGRALGLTGKSLLQAVQEADAGTAAARTAAGGPGRPGGSGSGGPAPGRDGGAAGGAAGTPGSLRAAVAARAARH